MPKIMHNYLINKKAMNEGNICKKSAVIKKKKKQKKLKSSYRPLLELR